jgi:multidrug efflux pump subunit AcrA (membrane-fusion protein)
MEKNIWVSRVYTAWQETSKRKKMALIALPILLITLFVFVSRNKKEEMPVRNTEVVKTVRLASVTSLLQRNQNFPILGTVTSVSEAVIRAESSGKLTRVYKNLGDRVTAGELIATFENSAEQASLLQAEGSYDAARASKEIATITRNNTNSSFADSKNNALNTFSSTLNSLDDAIRVKTDSSFTDAKTNNIKLNLSVPDANLVYTIEEQRKVIEVILKARDVKNKQLTSESDLVSELTTLEGEASLIKNYLDALANAYSKALPSQSFGQAVIDTGKALVSVARSQVTGSITSIQASKTSLVNSLAQKNIADKNSGGGTSSGISDATIKQSLGALNAAKSRYEKTLIRSPLSGTLNSLSIETGDFVTSFAQIGVVSNNGSLEVTAYVSAEDAKNLSSGQTGTAVSNNVSEKVVITKVAEALDPITKKIEVKLALLDNKKTFINGETVTVSLDTRVTTKNSKVSPILVPLSAIKMTPNGALVFTVVDGVVKEIKVKEGAIFGENIEIKEGMTEESLIIVDSRGIKDGVKVLTTP